MGPEGHGDLEWQVLAGEGAQMTLRDGLAEIVGMEVVVTIAVSEVREQD